MPFPGPTHDAVMRAKARGAFPPLRSLNPTVPPELANLIEEMLACDPRDRGRDAGQFADALLATPLPAMSDGPHATACLDPAPDMPTRIDHRAPPSESFASDRSAPPKAVFNGWPWVVGSGAVLLALLAGQWLRSRPAPEPPSPASVVQETPDAPDGLPPAAYQ